MTDKEWQEKQNDITVRFTNENAFIEKMKLNTLLSKLEAYSQLIEYKGQLFSVETIMREVFRFSEEQIEDELKLIQKEMKNPKFKEFYKVEEEGY